jgi:hypothetical protein
MVRIRTLHLDRMRRELSIQSQSFIKMLCDEFGGNMPIREDPTNLASALRTLGNWTRILIRNDDFAHLRYEKIST